MIGSRDDLVMAARSQVYASLLALLAATATAAAPCLAQAGQPRAAWLHPGAGVGLGGLLAPADDDTAKAQEAYKAGEKAYRLGDFEAAAGHFEEAYELSDLPDILYNIGLSHLRWYDIDPDTAHLRKAKVVFQNYLIEIQKNPELGDAEEAEALIAKIDEKIAAHEDAEDEGDEGEGGGPSEPIDLGPDPGKKLRLGGAIGMGVGGALVVAGVVGGVVLGVRGQSFQDDLAIAYDQRDTEMCTPNDNRQVCQDIFNRIDVLRRNGQRANALAFGVGLALGGVGVIGLVTGAVLFIQGNKKTQEWEKRKMSLAPVWTGDQAGLMVSGRF